MLIEPRAEVFRCFNGAVEHPTHSAAKKSKEAKWLTFLQAFLFKRLLCFDQNFSV